MAPLPVNNTGRMKITYQNAVAEHQVIIRVADTAGLVDAATAFVDVMTEVGALFRFSEVTGVEYSAEGSDFFFPMVAPALTGFDWGDGPANKDTNPIAATFVGRSGGGRKARFTIFAWGNVTSEYRVTGAEDSRISDAVAILDAAETSFLAIDGLPVIWKGYVDIKPNDHWVGKSRG